MIALLVLLACDPPAAEPCVDRAVAMSQMLRLDCPGGRIEHDDAIVTCICEKRVR